MEEIKMDIQRVRNLTTGILHTDILCIYEDIEIINGERGLMAHMLPGVLNAITPWLKQRITDSRFWDGKLDKKHTGEISIQKSSEDERFDMFERYKNINNLVFSHLKV